jgi:hypothetical protein
MARGHDALTSATALRGTPVYLFIKSGFSARRKTGHGTFCRARYLQTFWSTDPDKCLSSQRLFRLATGQKRFWEMGEFF